MTARVKAVVHVYLKEGVLDVQGKAVETALHGLGWASATNVRVGKVIEMDVEAAEPGAAQAQVEAMCDKLLANPVIERWRVEIAR